jgi:hypothetical protein
MASELDITVTPENLEELARGPVRDLADDYEDLVYEIRKVGIDRANAFGAPSAEAGGSALAETWDTYYGHLYDLMYQTTTNLRTFSELLIAAAEEYDSLEISLVDEFAEHESSVNEEQAQERRENTEAPPPSDYMDELTEAEEEDLDRQRMNDEFTSSGGT